MIDIDRTLCIMKILRRLSDPLQIAGIQTDHQVIWFMIRIVRIDLIKINDEFHFACRWFQIHICFDIREIDLQIGIQAQCSADTVTIRADMSGQTNTLRIFQ